MSTVELSGLSITTPLGFMAALGLLRICAQDHGEQVGLAWGANTARLDGICEDHLTELLVEHLRGRHLAPEFNLEVSLAGGQRGPFIHLREIPRADYRAAAHSWSTDPRALSFLAGYGTDAVINKYGHVARTQFDFSSARQCLALEFRRLAESLDPQARCPAQQLATRIQRALYGGAYEDQHTFGWDPATLLTHAHQAISPSASATPGQPVAVWLAVESLPLHPVLPTGHNRAITVGFVGSQAYAWPQWSAPLSLPEVRMLRQRQLASLHSLPGVEAVWMAGITRVGNFRFFLPATRTTSDRLGHRRYTQGISLT